MDSKKLDKNFWRIVSHVFLFAIYWIGFTAMYLVDSFDWIRTIIAIAGNALTLYWVCNDLIEFSEPYELDRVTRYWHILYGLRPTAFEAIVVLLGYSIMNISSVASRSPEISETNQLLFVIMMMFGVLLIILGAKWWQDTLTWRIDIQKYRVPKSEWL